MNKVRFEKRGFLYVEIKDIDNNISVIKVKNPFDDIPESVDIIKVKDEYFVKGFEPQTKYTRKTNFKEEL